MLDSGLFEAALQIEATAVVTHPLGTTIDEDGNLIPPSDKDDNT